MDPVYEDSAGRPCGLLIGLEDRLNCDDASIIHQLIDSRHYALALEEIARAVTHREIGITVQEYVGILALADLVDLLARATQAPLKGELVRELVADG